MSKSANFALRGLGGIVVVGAVLLAVWMAPDSSAGAGGEAAPGAHAAPSHRLYSARGHRAPVTRTAIPMEQQPRFETETTSKAAAP